MKMKFEGAIALLLFAAPAAAQDDVERSDRNGDGELSTRESIAGIVMGNTANPSGKGIGVLLSRSPGPHLNSNTGDGGFSSWGSWVNNEAANDPERNPGTGLPADN